MIAEFLFAIAFTVCFYLHEKYRIKDEQTADLTLSAYLKKQWHKCKGAVQLVVFGYMLYVCYNRHLNWFYAFGVTKFCASLFWLFHDGLLNSFVFKKEWWYVGTTGNLDRRFGRRFISIAKIAFLVISIILLSIWTTFY
jgi:hypothetical protein